MKLLRSGVRQNGRLSELNDASDAASERLIVGFTGTDAQDAL